MGDAVHRENMGIENPVMGVDQVDARPVDFPMGEPGEAWGRQEFREGNDGDLVEFDDGGFGLQAIGKYVHLIVRIGGDILGKGCGELLGAADKTVFWDDNGYFPDL